MQRTHYIFVDYQNVQEIDLDLIKDKPVKLVVVSGADQKSPAKLASKLPNYADQVSWVLSPGKGRNALDFVLAYQVGRALAGQPDAVVHIVSRDKDFEALLEFLNDGKKRAYRYDSFAQIPILMRAERLSLQEKVERVIDRLNASQATRPAKEASLASHVSFLLGGSLSPPEIAKVVNELVKRKVLRITEDKKVAYSA